MIYKIAISSLLISVGIASLAYAFGWIQFSTVIVMTISGAIGGLVAFQSAKNHN
ncbi:hypothetical protein [Kordia sp.]|uniref:hypothetical protein n=1 Tax=Kordia sp. TaxID=1965332 RepID=UPI003D6AF6C7